MRVFVQALINLLIRFFVERIKSHIEFIVNGKGSVVCVIHLKFWELDKPSKGGIHRCILRRAWY